MWTRENTSLATWFERDRGMVALSDARTGGAVLEVWDQDVHALVQDGFLDPRDWHGSAVEYANHLGLVAAPSGQAPDEGFYHAPSREP
jgi:hypothetical protein